MTRFRSGQMNEAGFEAEGQVLLQSLPEVGLAMGLHQVLKRTHFRAVFGTGPDLLRTAPGKLGVARLTEERRGERWNEAIGDQGTLDRIGGAVERGVGLTA